ncbi:MAG: FprA family A-type flavoprotein [Firmicutes bacterium]|nr:FprA family A-type flavoprotein [Bacillota bacterium]MBQ4092417.1 FprA family A-type flavoprotein [Bacillota bacterium]
MYCVKKVTEDLTWIGGNDRRLELFENVFPIPEGVSYNSYFLNDEKTVLLDTVDYAVSRVFLENLEHVLNGRKLDYVIINHMEPDHAATAEVVAKAYPEATFVCNDKTLKMMKQFFNFDIDSRVQLVAEGDTLSTGKHEFHFVMAPMVHWPEVMVSYDATDKILFSADAFGTFGTLDGKIFNDEFNFDRDLIDHARRYYTNIVGKYGNQVQKLLKKAEGIDIQMICPLHGPVWRSNIGYFLEKHVQWSTYKEEKKGIVVIYASMYGGTENMAEIFAAGLADKGITEIAVYDASKTHPSYLIGEIFKYSHVAIASPTYNSNAHPVIETLLNDMEHLAVQNKTVAIMENGTWAAQSGKKIRKALEEMKNITILEPTVSIKSTMKEAELGDMQALIDACAASLIEE